MNTFVNEDLNDRVNKLEVQWGISLSPIRQIAPSDLQVNPRNPYPELTAQQMEDLIEDIRVKSMLEPMLARPDGVLVDGHNRLEAAKRLNLDMVPVIVILSPDPLPDELELDIMTSANDRRRGGKWGRDQQLQFVRDAGGEELLKERRGGDRVSSQTAEGKTASGGSGSLAKQIAEKSGGMMSERTVERRIAEIRSSLPRIKDPQIPERTLDSLSTEERQKADSIVEEIRRKQATADELRLQLNECQNEIKAQRKELSKIAPVHLFDL